MCVHILLISLCLSPLHTSPHLLSAVCWSTQLVTSINTAVSQHDSRPVSCVVDVDWLKVWVQLVVKGEMNTKEMYSWTDCLLCGLKLTLDRGYGDCLSWGGAGFLYIDVQLGLTSYIAGGGRVTACLLTAVYVKNYTAQCIVGKYWQTFV